MALLNALTLTTHAKSTALAPHVKRRYKLIAKLEEQLKMAQDSSYVPTKSVWHNDADGTQVRVAVPKRVKRWWAEQTDGTVVLTLRYGSKTLELAKGKNAILVHSKSELPTVLQSLKTAIEQGELDKILEEQTRFAKPINTNSKANG